MSLSLALNSALSGIKVNQKTMALISNNIANANTEGYSRQIVNLESVSVDGVGFGVRFEDVTRKVDEYLQSSIHKQGSSLGYSEVINEYYDTMQVLLGDPAQSNSIDDHIEIFFNDLQQMAETPERTSTRAAVTNSGQILAREVSSLALGLEELRFQADNELNDAIVTVNQRLAELFSINEGITEAVSLGHSTATLLDERDLLVEEISTYLDVKTVEHENATIDLYAGDGVNLLDTGYSRLEYTPITSIDTLLNDLELSPVALQQLDEDGQPLGLSLNIVSGGKSNEIEARFTEGKISAYMAVRDDVLPNILDQLDQLASQLRDNFNEIHNQGSGYPPATSLTSTSSHTASERNLWEGSVRLAALNEDGTPFTSAFNDELNGMRPLTMDLSSLYSGQAFGEVDTQTIIDEINNHYGIPQNRLSMGKLNNVQMGMVSNDVPGTGGVIEFDFDIENISTEDGEFWLDTITVLDDTGADITSTTNTLPSIALSGTNTFVTTNLSDTVVVNTTNFHNLQNGDMVRLANPGGPVNGIPATDFDNYFVISNVTDTSFEITVANAATGTGGVNLAAQTAVPPYDTIEEGDKRRTQQQGTVSANLNGNLVSDYYDINVEMMTRDESGTLTSTTATFRVLNPSVDTMNDRISARALVGSSLATLKVPNDNRPILRAFMVDEDGIEVPTTNNNYGESEGFLKIESLIDGVTFALDDTGTRHLGLPSDVPPRPGDNRGFSHHYGMNNFFSNNALVETGDTLKGSALNLAVEQRLRDNHNLISTGNLQLSNQPSDGSALYTYELYSGDHSVAQSLAGLGINRQTFDAAGELPSSSLTFNGYAGELLGYITANAIAADRNLTNDEILLDGYTERADAISGVNLDEELANTIIYQNAYAASARVISVTDELFDTLLQAF